MRVYGVVAVIIATDNLSCFSTMCLGSINKQPPKSSKREKSDTQLPPPPTAPLRPRIIRYCVHTDGSCVGSIS